MMSSTASAMTNSGRFSGSFDPELLLAKRVQSTLEKRSMLNRLASYRPYPKQRQFHAEGAAKRERLFMAGNQLGKTIAGAFEVAMHLTGRYPEWWTGRRFAKPVTAWAAGVSGESTRDNPQRLLMGRDGAIGTGAIPAASIESYAMARGIQGAMDTVRVRHVSGRWSTLAFKSYEKGRAKWQGETLDLVWFDEEPPMDIYSEGLTRTNATGGMVFVTATPLLGLSEVIRRFLQEESPDRAVIQMTIDDAEHYTPEERAKIVAGYPEFEREARAKGIPMLGSGRIFPVAESAIMCDPFKIPEWWPQIGGLDFGWDHPTAAARLAWDRDNDRVYVTTVYRAAKAVPAIHAAALKAWGAWLPWAWPHDGLQHSKDSGEPLADQYRVHGLRMLPDRAKYRDARGSAVEAGLIDMLERMQTGKLKVFSNCAEWFEEFRLYHRKDGQVVKERDDLMAATRYAIMCLPHARVAEQRSRAFTATSADWNPLA